MTDLGLCKKVEVEKSTWGDVGPEPCLNIHSAEAVLCEANAALGAGPDGGLTESEGGSSPRSKRPHHRERVLAYSTVGTPDYIAPEVCASPPGARRRSVCVHLFVFFTCCSSRCWLMIGSLIALGNSFSASSHRLVEPSARAAYCAAIACALCYTLKFMLLLLPLALS